MAVRAGLSMLITTSDSICFNFLLELNSQLFVQFLRKLLYVKNNKWENKLIDIHSFISPNTMVAQKYN